MRADAHRLGDVDGDGKGIRVDGGGHDHPKTDSASPGRKRETY